MLIKAFKSNLPLVFPKWNPKESNTTVILQTRLTGALGEMYSFHFLIEF